MKNIKRPTEVAETNNSQVQVTGISFNLESGDIVALGVDPIKDPIPRNSHVTQQRMNSVIEPFEVAYLPMGLEENDLLSRSPLSLQKRNEAERVFLSSHRPLKSLRPNNLRPSSVAVISDLPDFSSTTDLTPLSVVTFKEEKSQRNIWLDNASLMAMSLALCNIWRLPTFIYFNYSGEALIAYIILMILVGLPIFLLELSLGQFGQTGVIKLWNGVPFFKGIGVAQMIAGLYQASYFPTLITWAFQFGIIGIGGWNGCESSIQNLSACLCKEPGSTSCNLYGVISEEEFCFESDVLYKYDEHTINYKMIPMLAAVLILIALCISFGAKVMKIILTLSGVICCCLLSVVLALALSHPNNSLANSNNTVQIGINLLSPTEPWGFGRGEVWYGAMVQVLFSLTIGFGTLPSLSSSSYFSRNIIRDGVLIWFINISLAVLSVITTFAWIGISGLYEKDVAQPNAFIYFVYYNISNSLWAGLAFGLVFLSGLNSMLPLMYAIIQNLYENFPALKQRYQKLTYCLLFVAIWLINIPGLIPAGNEVVTMWDHYAAGGTVLTCLCIHLIGWLWVYGGKNLKRDFEFMINRPINIFWNVSWSYVTIIVLLIAELWGFAGLPLNGTTDCLYPIWLVATGWSFYLLALIVAFLVGIRVVVRETEYELIKKFTNSMKADRQWGPIDPLLNFHWKRAIELQSGPVPYSMDTISRRLNEEGDQKTETDISSNFNQNSLPKSRRASITMVRLPYYERHYDEHGLTTIE